jgi:protein tyrosine/serine phosphatase
VPHSGAEDSPIALRKRSGRRWLVYALGALLVLAATAGGLGLYTGLLGDNFREVSPGKCYRSGQLSPKALRRYVQEYGIRCVVSVRGGSEKAAWYHGELQACKELNCLHAAYHISLGHLPEPNEVNGLVARLEQGPYPMLLHCKQGADRAAFGSVLYLMLVEHKTLDEALAAALTWRYGHVAMGKAAVIDEFFELYRATADGKDIKTWSKEVYPKLYLQRK